MMRKGSGMWILARPPGVMVLTAAAMCAAATPAYALDSYRYLHVKLDTVWIFFIFLFFLVFAPMIVMAVLYWWHATKKSGDDDIPEE